MQMIPIGKRLVIEPERPPGTTKGGIVLPDNVKKPPQTGIVVGVGEGWPPGVTIGSRVLFEQYTGADWRDEASGRVYKVLDDKFVLAVLEG